MLPGWRRTEEGNACWYTCRGCRRTELGPRMRAGPRVQRCNCGGGGKPGLQRRSCSAPACGVQRGHSGRWKCEQQSRVAAPSRQLCGPNRRALAYDWCAPSLRVPCCASGRRSRWVKSEWLHTRVARLQASYIRQPKVASGMMSSCSSAPLQSRLAPRQIQQAGITCSSGGNVGSRYAPQKGAVEG